MTIALQPWLASHLHAHACNAIMRSHQDAVNEIAVNHINPSQWETKFVAHLCCAMVDVAKNWGIELSAAKTGMRLSMATVFTHQSPYVKWMSSGKSYRCELSDLLVAIIDRTGSNPNGVACLIQAKLSNTGSVILTTKSEKTQFELLSTRPTFDVDTPSAPKAVDLGANSPDSALLYSLTSSSSTSLPSPYAWPHCWLTAGNLRSAAGSYTVNGVDCLAYNLVGILVGTSGWGFALPPVGGSWKDFASTNPRDDWSMLINFLLEETFAKPLPHAQRISRGNVERGREDVVYLSGTSPSGHQMFSISHQLHGSKIAQLFGDDSGGPHDEWKVVNPNNLTQLTSDNGMNNFENQLSGNEFPPSGPLSAIVIEIGNK